MKFDLFLLPLLVIATLFLPQVVGDCTVTSCDYTTIESEPGCNGIFADGEDANTACDDASFQWGQIREEGYQADNSFMDGGGHLNHNSASEADLTTDAGDVIRFRAGVVGLARLSWPQYDELEPYVDRVEAYYGEPYMDNFNFTDSCDLRAAMCCFVATRTGEPIPPGDGNVDVCAHDIGSSRHSSRVANGFAFYDGANSDPYCVAMTWSGDESDWTNVYKGNALFELSYGTFLEKEFVKNIPGAPMCGCVENMPIVKPTTSLGCLKTESAGTPPSYLVKSNGEIEMSDGSAGSVAISRDCDFMTEYETLHANEPDLIAGIKRRILDPTTTCEAAKNDFLNERLYVPGTSDQFDPLVDVSSDNWAQFAGNGLSYFHTRLLTLEERLPFFKDLYTQSNNKIVYRNCPTCLPSHRHIFYKRLIDPPAEMNLLDVLLNNWYQANNNMTEHFTLHSTYEDALNGANAWSYCNYQDPEDSGVGFPRDCGPVKYVPCQWNSYTRGMCSYDYNPYSHGWYMDLSP